MFLNTTTRVLSDHNSLIFLFVFGTVLFVVLWWFVLFIFVGASLAVFSSARVFNQDVSKWDTGAVTIMEFSKCNVSPSLWPRHPFCCVFLNTTARESFDQSSPKFCYFCCFRPLLSGVGVCGLFILSLFLWRPLLQCF